MPPMDDLAWAVLEAAPDGMLVVNAEGRIVMANRRLEALFGRRQDELLGLPMEELVPPRSRAIHGEHVRRFLSAPNARPMGMGPDIHGLHADGSELPIEISLSPLRRPEGLLVIAAIRDLREHKRILSEVEMGQRRLTAAVELAGLGLWELDPATDTRWYSPELLAMLGLERSHGSREEFFAALHPDDREQVGAATQRALTDGTPYQLEVRVRRADGAQRWFETRALMVRDARGTVRLHGVVQDVTERRRAQEEAITSHRMAALGIVAAGVAHEINNPLTAILANLTLAQKRLQAGELGLLERVLAETVETAEHIRDVARDLRLFARANDELPAPIDVHEVLQSSLRIARNELRHRARVVTAWKPVPKVSGHASRLGQVFLNLLVNAAQAIPEGAADQHEIRLTTDVDDHGWVVVEVSDTGSGMPADVRDRLFAPFFTTKPAGAGTGLGLAICHRIVSSLGGEILVESAPGRGSRFRVRLPAAASAGPLAVEPKPAPGAVRRGRVLVVDDEPLVAKLIGEILAEDHDVTVTTCGREAVEQIDAGARFDVILCDLMMPELPGADVYELLRRSVPEQASRILFMTGGAFTERAQSFLSGVSNPTIDKPFLVDDLRAQVNRLIRSA